MTRRILVVVAVAGAGTMTVELAAVRLLAPWYGASSGVWTNVIGVILLALAIGYFAGARLSCGSSPARALGQVLILTALATAWLPYLARPVAEWFLPRGLALDEAASLLVWGSLAASILLFGPAAALLGCVGPLAVEVLQAESGGHAGDAGGRVLGASTLGSLVGTFATTHVLLPRLGLTSTFLGTAAILFVLGWAVLRWTGVGRPDATQMVGLLLLCAALGLSRAHTPEPQADQELLVEIQSPYQLVRVVERMEGGRPLRLLQVNESLDSFQSVWQPEPGLLPPQYYYNCFALPPWWAAARDDWRLLVLGLGAGTTVRVVEGALPDAVSLDSVGVEIDSVVVELGEEYFDLERSEAGRLVAAGMDARAALGVLEGPFDQIVLDAYANNMEIPAHLSSLEFFRECMRKLAPAGWLVVNAAGFGLDDPVVCAVAWTLAEATEARVLAVRVPFSRNCVLFARSGGDLPQPLQAGWRPAHEGLARIVAHLEVPGAWRWFEPGVDAAALTDDRNAIEILQRRSIRQGRALWARSL